MITEEFVIRRITGQDYGIQQWYYAGGSTVRPMWACFDTVNADRIVTFEKYEHAESTLQTLNIGERMRVCIEKHYVQIKDGK